MSPANLFSTAIVGLVCLVGLWYVWSTLSTDLRAVHQSLQKLDERIESVEQGSGSGDGVPAGLERRVRAVETAVKQLNGRLDDHVDNAVSGLQTDLNSVKTTVQNLDGRVSSISTKQQQTESALNTLTQSSNDIKAAADQANSTANRVSSGFESLQKDQSALKDTVDSAIQRYDTSLTFIDDYNKLRLGYVKNTIAFFGLPDINVPMTVLVRLYTDTELPKLYDIFIFDNIITDEKDGAAINGVPVYSRQRTDNSGRYIVVVVSPYLQSRRPVTFSQDDTTIIASSPGMNLQLYITYTPPASNDYIAAASNALSYGPGGVALFMDKSLNDNYVQNLNDTYVKGLRKTYPHVGSLPLVVLPPMNQYPLLAYWQDGRRYGTLYAAETIREVVGPKTRADDTQIWQFDLQLSTQFRELH